MNQEGCGISLVSGKGLDNSVMKVLGRLGVLAMNYRHVLAIEHSMRPFNSIDASAIVFS